MRDVASKRRVVLSGVAIGLSMALVTARGQAPAIDTGAVGAWQKILKLQTTASVMEITAHPDDEQGGVLARLSRRDGARVSLLTLTRGEAGDNAIGPELFDALGLIRTEELLVADRYYGVDRQYFTTMADYGFSKRLDEAFEKWGHDNVLRDVVRAIRIDRPLVILSRFQGNERDGHGQHQAAGVIAREAFDAAGDPRRFPEQIAAGLRAWQPLKLYVAGVRANEEWTIRVDSGEYDPVLGDSYASLARAGLSFQRSQNGGDVRAQPGPALSYFRRLQSRVAAPDRETGFFEGIDTSLPPAIDREVKSAAAAFRMTDPSAAVPALARALAATRAAIKAAGGDPAATAVLAIKERQVQDAIAAALGIVFTAFIDPPAHGPVVQGQAFRVTMTFVNRSPLTLTQVSLGVGSDSWHVRGVAAEGAAAASANQPIDRTVTLEATAGVTKAYFSRASIRDARYTIADERETTRPATAAPFLASVSFEVNGVAVQLSRYVERLEPAPPYGAAERVLAVVPALAVTLQPSQVVVPRGAGERRVRVAVDVTNNADGASAPKVSLEVPQGWRAEPASQTVSFARAGERTVVPFTIAIPSLEARDYRIRAVAAADGRGYREGYDVIAHRDLETRYLYKDAAATVRGIDVTIAPGLKAGYVMGIGDEVPAGLAQLGVAVTMLDAQDLATGDLGRFDAIVTGTRAYAVREDLKTYNRRLLDYVKNGGNLIVLYNTQELAPDRFAPYPGQLPPDAEEVSEEDSPVEILTPADPVFTTPNRITMADFDGWVEQRGSKFWSRWDPAFTPMIATWDHGQSPQKGGWLHAKYGTGHYTYFAYALHRQLPYGVPGAYRILANLLSLNQRPR